jgi:hypothetical protein
LHDHPITIRNILGEKHQRKLRFISCMRIDPEKGWKRMLQMGDMMRKEGIDFE